MKQITFKELCGMMDPVCYPHLLKQATTARFMVVFECQQMDSSNHGHRTVMAVGPGKTYETLKDVEGKHLHDLPSAREYPVSYVDTEAAEHWAVEQMDDRDEVPKWEVYVIYDQQSVAETTCIQNNEHKPECFSYQVRGMPTREYATRSCP